jgi:hypothetical protein
MRKIVRDLELGQKGISYLSLMWRKPFIGEIF